MKKIIILILALCTLGFSACDDSGSEINPVSSEKKGGNGNNPNTQPYTLIHTTPTDWNVQFDTSACGTFILTWNSQPGASTYYVDVKERPWNCAGSAVNTNAWYYTYGYGCSMLIGNTYTIQLSYFIKDDVNRVTTYYYSTLETVYTGSFGLWNCN